MMRKSGVAHRVAMDIACRSTREAGFLSFAITGRSVLIHEPAASCAVMA